MRPASSSSTMRPASCFICALPAPRTRSTTSIRPGRICGNGASRWLSIATSTASSERPTVLSRTPTSGLAQFGRALYELNIDIICANTPQVKGRVERANQTLQDRLVKEMRLRGIDTIEAANAYAPDFIADFNARFGKQPRNPKDMHRPLADHENLDGAMCRKEV